VPAGRSSPRGSGCDLRLRPVCLQYGTGALGRGRGRPRRRRGWRASCPCSPGTATVADPSPGRRTRHRGTQRPPPAVSAGRCRRAATILFPGDLLACLPRARPRLLLRSSTPPWIQFHQPWLAAKPPQTHRCQPEADRDQQLFPELKGLRREGTTQQLSEGGYIPIYRLVPKPARRR